MLLYTLLFIPLLLSPVTNSQQLLIPAFSAKGFCSPFPVRAFHFVVTSSPPGLHHVLACSEAAFPHLLRANLSSSDNEQDLPAPLLDMSCVGLQATKCERQFPDNRRLKKMTMCIIAYNEGSQPIQVDAQVEWIAKKDKPLASTTSSSSYSPIISMFPFSSSDWKLWSMLLIMTLILISCGVVLTRLLGSSDYQMLVEQEEDGGGGGGGIFISSSEDMLYHSLLNPPPAEATLGKTPPLGGEIEKK